MMAQSMFACLPALTAQWLPRNLNKQNILPQQGVYDAIEANTTVTAPREVFPDEVGIVLKPFEADSVVFQGGYTLLKGRVGTRKTDFVLPSKYEKGLKLWECTFDLVNTMQREMKDGQLSFRRKRVLELGCGHGLPGIFAMLKGATTVHFQGFNTEVLTGVTIPSVVANLDQARVKGIPSLSGQSSPNVHYYSGDWQDVFELLTVVGSKQQSDSSSEEEFSQTANEEGRPRIRRRQSNSSRAFESALVENVQEGGYDIILLSETVYSFLSLSKLYTLIKKCLRPPYGVLYVAAKKHYFGLGGGARQFKAVGDEDGVLGGHLVTDFRDGSSNIREIWKFFFR